MPINCSQIDGCLDCPAIPPTPSIPAHIEYDSAVGWRGANSINMLGGDVVVGDIKPKVGSVSVFVGLKRDRTFPSIPQLLSHSINFFLFEGFQFFRVVENGVPKTSNAEYTDDDYFYIERHGSTVTYMRDSGAGAVAFYVSRIPLSGDVLTNGCLYTIGDGIQ